MFLKATCPPHPGHSPYTGPAEVFWLPCLPVRPLFEAPRLRGSWLL